jgi:hypothetical protein
MPLEYDFTCPAIISGQAGNKAYLPLLHTNGLHFPFSLRFSSPKFRTFIVRY